MDKNKYQKIYNDFIETLSIISPVSEEIRAQVYSIFTIRKYKKNSIVIQSGTVPSFMGYIHTGLLKLYYTNEQNGETFVKFFASEGGFFSSHAAFLNREKSPFTAETLEDSILLTVNLQDYVASIDRERYWERLARIQAEQFLIKKEMREYEFLLFNAEQRYLSFHEKFQDLEERIKQKDIASYLGISPVSLSRIKSKKRLLA